MNGQREARIVDYPETATRIVERHSEDDERSFIEAEVAAYNSIEVTRNAKGDYQWSIKFYYRPDESWEKIINIETAIDAKLRERFLPQAVEAAEVGL